MFGGEAPAEAVFDEPEQPEYIDDYEDPADAGAVQADLNGMRRMLALRTVLTGILTALLLYLGLAVGDFSLMRENRLRLDYLPADCQLLGGDLVVTSGLGGYYPPDLSIGTVEEVQLSDSGASSYAVLVPEGDPEAPENPVALAFLPDGVGEGSRLLWQDLEYTLLP